jgi:arginine decarboxylase-like protein
LKELRQWTVKDSAELYNVAGWSAGFFRVNDGGHVEATPLGPEGPSVDMYDLILDLQRRGLGLPLLVRFGVMIESALLVRRALAVPCIGLDASRHMIPSSLEAVLAQRAQR